jgi:hypothetical protein
VTQLTKPLRRSVQVPPIIRPIVVTLDPDGKRIGFSEKGCRTTYWLHIATAYAMAIRAAEGGTK